jgi:hypothetical protein
VKKSKVFDLDALERDGDVPEPFGFTVGDDDFVVDDIDNLEWKTVLRLRRDDLEQFFSSVLGDDYQRFSEHTIPLWKVAELARRLDEHFGWTVKAGEQGEENASSTS